MAEDMDDLELQRILENPPPAAEQPPTRRVTKKPNLRVAALNITSFLDMSFCLLTTLILVVSSSMGEGVLTAKLPASMGQGGGGGGPKPPERPLNVLISSTGLNAYRIRIEGLPVAPTDFSSLTDQMVQLRFDPKTNPAGAYKDDSPVVIKPDPAARWQHVVNGFNAAIRARFKNVSFARVEPEK